MPTAKVVLLLAGLLPLQALAQSLGLADCRGLRERRDRLAAEAMQAEITLVLATRRRLCTRQEALAEQANASTAVADPTAGLHARVEQAPPSGEAPLALDYTAYLNCRRQAEQQLRRSRVVLYTNQRGFTFYTRAGARLARDADGWQQRLSASCPAAGGG
jgi:hypothetical protein